MPTKPTSARTRVRRLPKRGTYERETLDAILDETFFCHLGFVHEGQPFVIPTLHGRDGDTVYVHGSAASRALRTLARGAPVCLTATLVDGLVLARSAFHHSANYRSAMILGAATLIEQPAEKLRALKIVSEHVIPGRWDEVRLPNRRELKATTVLALPIDEYSAKIRTGPPGDDEEDYALDVWAGVVPLELRAGVPDADPLLGAGIPVSVSVERLVGASR
jgi:nitroimidazol reductase NimA-like FMN-containing flavoprotein (pyridoxamine 5'-phosphate oxidase superfamily)